MSKTHTHSHSTHGAPSLPDQGKTRTLFLAWATLFPDQQPQRATLDCAQIFITELPAKIEDKAGKEISAETDLSG